MKKIILVFLSFISVVCLRAQDPFLLPVEDVFYISGRGTVATGKIEKGIAKQGDSVDIIGLQPTVLKSKITAIESFNKSLTEAKSGDNIGLLLSGVSREQVKRGMIICKPGTVKAYTTFTGELQMLTKEEGGRHTPVANQYRPQFSFYTAMVSGSLTLPSGTSLAPGEKTTVTVTLMEPAALTKDTPVLIKEGGRTVGSLKIVTLLQ